MIAQSRRRIQAAFAAVVGGASLAASGPLLGVVAEPSMCLGLSPQQAWIGLHLHLVSASPECSNGGYVATEVLAPMVGVTVVVSVSALVFGLLSLAFVGGGLVTAKALLHRVGHWLRQHLIVAFDALSPMSAAPVLVRVDGRPGRRAYARAWRRGPPDRFIG